MDPVLTTRTGEKSSILVPTLHLAPGSELFFGAYEVRFPASIIGPLIFGENPFLPGAGYLGHLLQQCWRKKQDCLPIRERSRPGSQDTS